MLELKEEYKIRHFVECGTFMGDTAVRAAKHFANVTTIEYCHSLYAGAKARYSDEQRINFLFGDSRSVLPGVLHKLQEPALLWMDSHWSGGDTYGAADECPLLKEIEIINKCCITHFLFIDDARLFLGPPPKPHKISAWPSIEQVLHALNVHGQRYYVTIIGDCIVATPWELRETISRLFQDLATAQWERYKSQTKHGPWVRLLARLQELMSR